MHGFSSFRLLSSIDSRPQRRPAYKTHTLLSGLKRPIRLLCCVFVAHIVASAPVSPAHRLIHVPHIPLLPPPQSPHSPSALAPAAVDRTHQRAAFVFLLIRLCAEAAPPELTACCHSVQVAALNSSRLARIIFNDTKGAPAQSFVAGNQCSGFV